MIVYENSLIECAGSTYERRAKTIDLIVNIYRAFAVEIDVISGFSMHT